MSSVDFHVNSLFNSVSYRIGNIIIDPGDEWESFYDAEAVLLTHAHFDHIYGLNRLVELNPNIQVITNEFGAKMLGDSRMNMSFYHGTPFSFEYPDIIKIVKDQEFLNIGDNNIKVFETPGHNPSCLTFAIDDKIFTGDAYIPGVKTVTNLPKGDKDQADKSIERILELSKDKRIYPGHHI